MAELDLVPGRYRHLLDLQRTLRRFGIAFLAAMVALAVVKSSLAYGVHDMQAEIDRIDAARILEQAVRAELETLRGLHGQAERRVRIVSGLRGGVSARDMFRVVEEAGGGPVWFLDWKFRRAGEVVDHEPRAVKTGYFLVVPLESDEGETEKAWRLETHMEIRGRALDHSALASFVRGLLGRSQIENVRVLRTGTRTYTDREVVDFELAVVVRSAA